MNYVIWEFPILHGALYHLCFIVVSIVSELDSACLSWMSCLSLSPFNHSVWSKGTMHTNLYSSPSLGQNLSYNSRDSYAVVIPTSNFCAVWFQYIMFISNHYIWSSWFSAIWVIGSYSYTLPANFHNFIIKLSLEWSCLIPLPMVWQLPEQHICIASFYQVF